jgi:hypothetical protein
MDQSPGYSSKGKLSSLRVHIPLKDVPIFWTHNSISVLARHYCGGVSYDGLRIHSSVLAGPVVAHLAINMSVQLLGRFQLVNGQFYTERVVPVADVTIRPLYGVYYCRVDFSIGH